MYTVTRKPNMNRVYITGDVGAITSLLSDFRARYDSPTSYWLPLYEEPRLRAALAAEAEYQARIASAQSEWETAKAVIPTTYRTRHGAMLGGTVHINGEAIYEPALDTSRLPWQYVATHETRVRDLTGRSSIDGRVMDSDTLYSATTEDGTAIYRISHGRAFGDDLRETYYLPEGLWHHMMAAEVRLRGITPQSATAWLAQYRGCVGTELYEFAAQSLPSAQPRPGISA